MALRSITRRLLVLSALTLVACARAPGPAPEGVAHAWYEVDLPGKMPTRYRRSHVDGRDAWHARAERSASLMQRAIDPPTVPRGTVQFSWWVPELIEPADLRDPDRADSPVRVVLAFDGDMARLPARTRAMYELARTLTGREPPYATLMYVWSNDLPIGTIVPGGRSDRIRKIVVDSGPGNLRQWRVHTRDVARDFQLAFGEEPGLLKAVGMMTDADNTGANAEAWYGEIELHQR